MSDKNQNWRAGPCQGACDEHAGDLSIVHVDGWGEFRYCEAAIAEDKVRGLIVRKLDETKKEYP